LSENIIGLVRETWIRNLFIMGLVTLPMMFFPQRWALLLGMLLGMAAAMLNFLIIAWNTESIMDRNDSLILSFGAFYILRIILSGLCIFIGIRFANVNLFTVVLGLFSIRISMTLTTALEMIFKSFRKADI